jgi:undecaprenyl-diphosphatase
VIRRPSFAASVVRLDHRVHAAVARRRPAKVQHIVRAMSQLGSSAVTVPSSAIAAGVLLARGKRGDAARVLAAAAGAALMGAVLQHTFHRERPAEGRAETSSSSFPSTHTLNATAAYSTIAATLAGSDILAERLTGAVMFAVLVPFVPASRVILGMHWLSDVVGSGAMGASIALTVCSVWRRD